LTMPDSALTEDLLNGQVIRDCIAENARAWYEYARRRRGRIVQNGEIRVVGWDKVRPWVLQHLLAPVASQLHLRSKLMTKPEPLGPTVGNALVVEAEE